MSMWKARTAVNNGRYVCLSSSLALLDSVKSCGAEALSLLAQMKQRDGLVSADSGELKAFLEVILTTAEVQNTPHHTTHQSNSPWNPSAAMQLPQTP